MHSRSRTLLIAAALIGLSALSTGLPAKAVEKSKSATVYIGTYTAKGSKGIYAARFDRVAGVFSNLRLAAETVDPSFLALHPKKSFLYSVNEGAAKVSAFSIAPGSGNLKPLNQQDSGGNGPCHLALDPTGRMLIVANYGAGSFAVYPVEGNGRIGPHTAVVKFTGSGPDKGRQEGPHAHDAVITPDRRFVLIADLGTDRTMAYRIHPETGTIEPANPPFAKANPGAGPRHLAIDPRRRFVYVVNEMASTITRYAFETSSGAMRKMDTVSTLPAGFHGSNTAAEIMTDRQGHTVYASNRGHDSISVFGVDDTGTLRMVQNISSGGHTPRSFTLDPNGHWLVSANQDSNNLSVFRVDPSTGRLSSTGKSMEIQSPACVLFSGPS